MINALVALIPLGFAIILLMVFRQNSKIVGSVTLGSAAILVIVYPPFHLSLFRIAISLGTGAAASLTLLTILFPAIILYHIQRLGGAMSILIEGILHITPDQDLLVLLLVFGLAPFLDALCGANAGIFVIVPILLNLGLSPLRVACLCMVSLVTSIWGTMGVVILLISNEISLPGVIIGSDSAILLIPATLCLCGAALWFTGRSIRVILQAWWPIMGTSTILTFGAWIVTRLAGVELVGMLTDLVTIAFLAAVGRWRAKALYAQSGLFRRDRLAYLQWQLWRDAFTIKATLPNSTDTIDRSREHVCSKYTTQHKIVMFRFVMEA